MRSHYTLPVVSELDSEGLTWRRCISGNTMAPSGVERLKHQADRGFPMSNTKHFTQKYFLWKFQYIFLYKSCYREVSQRTGRLSMVRIGNRLGET
jgi:hypothetical protein